MFLLSTTSNNDPSEKPWPWVVALIIGILTVLVNLYISRHTRKVSLDIAQRQFDSAKEISKQQFLSDLNSKNRQDWINTLRDCISDFLSQCIMLNNVYSKSPLIESNAESYFQQAVLLRSKIRMMLNEDKPEQAKIIDDVEDLLDCSGPNLDMAKYVKVEEALLTDSRTLLSKHWDKIKTLNNGSRGN